MILNRPDEEGRLARWAQHIVGRSGGRTLAILSDMMETIRREFQYQRRPKPGTQDPVQTLDLGTGSCRDFALLMIEALRSLGFAARFVSGYIYSPGRTTHQGGGATHAWVQVYLPGCGWLEIDPTNGIFGNRDLIRVAVARDHKQAAPLTGSFTGPRGAYQGMSISVSVVEQVTGASAA
jgi:transglutaminase-like putative cysteine protease